MKSKISTLLLFLIIVFSLNCHISYSQVGIGTITPDNSALLELNSISKGLLIPRTDTASITNPAEGLIIYDINEKELCYYNGNSWLPLISFNTIISGNGIGSSNDSLYVEYAQGLDISAGKLIAKTTDALWNANSLQGNSVTTVGPASDQILTFDGTNWTPASVGGLLTAGDGLDITGNTLDVDVTDFIGKGLSEDASNNLTTTYGTTSGTAVEGNQTATIFTGSGLSGGTTSDALGDGFALTINAQTTTALWNANQLQGVGMTTVTPTSRQVLAYNGSSWTPTSSGTLLTRGDGIDITIDSISVDVSDILGTGLSEDASNNITVSYGTNAGTAVQGNQLATITAGNGLLGGISNDALGNGFSTSLSVDYGTTANTAVQGNQTATITAGTGLTGGISSDVLGDGFTTILNAQTTTALWNANQIQGRGITTTVPSSGQVLTYNGANWTPIAPGSLLNAGDGINISGNTIDVDVTDIIGTGLSEDASNNILVNYGTATGTAVQGNQTLTITAGIGISGGVNADTLGDGVTTTISAQNTTALWNSNQLQGIGISTNAPINGQVLAYNGASWIPTIPGNLLNEGDGINITGITVDVDVTDIIGTGLTEDAFNNMVIIYGNLAGRSVEGNQTATITAGTGLSGGISADALGDGFSTTLNVKYDSSLWNAAKLMGVGISTTAPTSGQILRYNSSDWVPVTPNWGISSSDIYSANSGNVGVGISSPARKTCK